MLNWMLTAACTVLVLIQSQEGKPAADTPPDTQPASRPSEFSTTLRRPEQANILKGLLRREERPEPVKPEDPDAASGEAETKVGADGKPLLLEGTLLVERPGRLVREEGRSKFVLHAEGDASAARSMEILPNQLLEAIEREAEAGFTEFVVTAEVTRYRDRNYLILLKILRRVGHGNLSP